MIKKYTNEFLTEVIALYIDVFTNQPWNYNWMEEKKIVRYFEDMEKTPNFEAMIFFEEEKIIGICFGVLSDYFMTCNYEIKEIFVKRGLQNKGYGTKMLKEIETYLLNLGVQVITLSTQRDIKAFRYYEKNDYLVSEAAVFMYKIL